MSKKEIKKSRQKEQKCPKCGASMRKTGGRHRAACDKVAAPVEYLREYVDSGDTLTAYAERTGVTKEFARARLILGSVEAHGTVEFVAQMIADRSTGDGYTGDKNVDGRAGKVQCPRCRLWFASLQGTHMKLCETLPVPEDLARAFVDSGETLESFSRGYAGSKPNMRKRLLAGGVIVLGSAKKMAELIRLRGRNAIANATAAGIETGRADYKVRCRRCTIFIDHPAVEPAREARRLCRDCEAQLNAEALAATSAQNGGAAIKAAWQARLETVHF